jgi:uncharacterized Tic20 family protein
MTDTDNKTTDVVNQIITADDKNLAVIAHLGGTIFSVFPSLIIWLLKKDDSTYVADQAREALNFQITLLIAYCISYILVVILIGVVFLFIIWVANIVLCIIAAVACSKGESYRYPFALRLLN